MKAAQVEANYNFARNSHPNTWMSCKQPEVVLHKYKKEREIIPSFEGRQANGMLLPSTTKARPFPSEYASLSFSAFEKRIIISPPKKPTPAKVSTLFIRHRAKLKPATSPNKDNECRSIPFTKLKAHLASIQEPATKDSAENNRQAQLETKVQKAEATLVLLEQFKFLNLAHPREEPQKIPPATRPQFALAVVPKAVSEFRFKPKAFSNRGALNGRHNEIMKSVSFGYQPGCATITLEHKRDSPSQPTIARGK